MRGNVERGRELEYALSGISVFTLQNEGTSNRFTFKAIDARMVDSKARKEIYFLKVLTGPDNSSDYSFVGTIQVSDSGYVYKHSKKSRMTEDAQSVKVAKWFLAAAQGKGLPENIKMYHEGRCGRCGRKLTVPESVESGYGPECIQIVRSLRTKAA